MDIEALSACIRSSALLIAETRTGFQVLFFVPITGKCVMGVTTVVEIIVSEYQKCSLFRWQYAPEMQ